MCKVLIKEVTKVHAGAKGNHADGSPWRLHVMDCLVSVDGSEVVTRTVKTFEDDVAMKIANLPADETLVLDAEKEGENTPCIYMIRKPKKKFQPQGSGGPSNRQVALRCAVQFDRTQARHFEESSTPVRILGHADVFLMWLNQKD